MVTMKKSTLWILLVAILVVAVAIIIIWNPFKSSTGSAVLEGSTFSNTGDSIARDSEGKPYVILFSTTWCPHCIWIKDTFDSLIQEDFASQVNIQHWELDTGDNTITPEIETEVPAEITALYEKYNPQGSIPTFVFGGKYTRVGNGYERQKDLAAEKQDFELVIEKLLE
ncbi:MAG: thioredoxin family protein [Candidatus Pacearchaeota archaeon]|nr:thioredoxin family protein [Candidatus Pacearchaeota archaeon]